VEGPYKGGIMVLDMPTFDGPCKGEGCDHEINWRFAKVGNRMVFLPRISNGKLSFPCAECSPFPKLGLSVEQDLKFTVPSLEYPKTIYGESSRQELKFYREASARPALDKMRPVFRHKTLGNVYENGDFSIYRPDGTSLMYSYHPDISAADIEWTEQTTKAGILYAVSERMVRPAYGGSETPQSLVFLQTSTSTAI
jgi:hypothetical protein